MKVSVLAIEDCTSIAMIGPMELLAKSGQIYNEVNQIQDNESFFDVEIVSDHSKMVNTCNNYPIYCHRTIDQVEKTDLVIIPALEGNIPEKLTQNKNYIEWITDQYEKGADVASICTGAFLLAETGLLNGKSATTHWIAADQFKKMYPAVNLLSEKIIVDEGNIYTCGGAMSFTNLMIYLVEKYCGKEVASLSSKMFLIDINKGSQDSYAIFSTQKSHSDNEILSAQNYIENNYMNKISIKDVAMKVAISPRNFIRRFKNATGNTPIQYIQRVRVEAVKKALETKKDSIENIVQISGYDDISSFRKLFKKTTGVSLREYRNRYYRTATVI